MINLAICDDSRDFLINIINIVNEYITMTGNNVSCKIYENASDLIDEIESGTVFHL